MSIVIFWIMLYKNFFYSSYSHNNFLTIHISSKVTIGRHLGFLEVLLIIFYGFYW